MMIRDILQNGKLNLSLEVFPPKAWLGLDDTLRAVDRMAELAPSFISVTYGAAGGTRAYTAQIASHIQNADHIPALAHMTCVGTSRENALSLLDELKKSGVQNILALRGDRPSGGVCETDFTYASDLISFLRENSDLCIGGACYPEGHPEAETLDRDMEALKIKEACGVDFFTTQMFFDNNIFYCFLNKLYQKGIKTPVITGIMPITNAGQIKRVMSLSGTAVPPRFRAIVEKFGDDPAAMHQAGVIYATEQIIDLYANGVKNVHIYTMNRPETAAAIRKNLSEILK